MDRVNHSRRSDNNDRASASRGSCRLSLVPLCDSPVWRAFLLCEEPNNRKMIDRGEAASGQGPGPDRGPESGPERQRCGVEGIGGLEDSRWLCPIEDRRLLDSLREGVLAGFSLCNYLLLADYTGCLFRDGKAAVSCQVAGILDWLGTTAETWQARLEKFPHDPAIWNDWPALERVKPTRNEVGRPERRRGSPKCLFQPSHSIVESGDGSAPLTIIHRVPRDSKQCGRMYKLRVNPSSKIDARLRCILFKHR